MFLAIKVVYGTVRTRVQYVYNCPEYFHSSFRTKVLSYVRILSTRTVLVRVHLYEDTFVHTSYLPSKVLDIQLYTSVYVYSRALSTS